jgi:hypothetical protein
MDDIAKLKDTLEIYKLRCSVLQRLVDCYRYKKRITESLMDDMDKSSRQINAISENNP